MLKAVDAVADSIPDALTKHLPMEIPPQRQTKQPGIEDEMNPKPIYIRDGYKGSGKLEGKNCLITGGDSGIGRAVALHFAKEGANVAIMHLPEEDVDARETIRLVTLEGRKCISIAGDVRSPKVCTDAVARTVAELGSLEVLVNNAAVQHYHNSMDETSATEIDDTFRVNIYGYFYMVQAALPHLKEGAAIVNTASITAYKGAPHLMAYSATKGAIVAFTRSLSAELISKGIRVNGVAPGPIWTPFIPSTFPKDALQTWKSSVPMGRPGQPSEMAPAYVLLASEDGSYFTGQVLHPNGGEVING